MKMKSTSFVGWSRPTAILLAALVLLPPAVRAAALIDVWRADSINLNDGDTVGTWNRDRRAHV